MSLLYKDYRGQEYQQIRARDEPLYTCDLNNAIGCHPTEIDNRKRNTVEIIRRHMAIERIQSVLDFGGDRGQFIPDEIAPDDRFVYDISGVEPLAGVKRLASPGQLRERRFDLVMCSNVLEHVSKPRDVLQTLFDLGHERTLFYFEVPLESPFEGMPAQRSLRAVAWHAVCRLPFALRLLQYLSGRPEFCMHEHVNLYSTASLKKLLLLSSFVPLELRDCRIDVGWSRVRAGCCLCKKRVNGVS